MAGRCRLRAWLRAALVLPCLVLAGWNGPAAPAAAQSAIRPAVGDRCPVCGMFVARHQDWAARIMVKDGPAVWFDGAKDMFTFLLDPAKYRPSARPADLSEVTVHDYYAVAAIDGRKAYYVLGSDVRGPMGAELIPFEKLADAQEFKIDHHGTAVLLFDAVTPDVLSGLR